MIKVFIADDHPALRLGIKQRLDQYQDIRVVGEAGSGPELFAALRTPPPPDVLLLDIDMPEFNILRDLPEIRALCPQTKVLVVTVYDDTGHINQLITAGVKGYVVKQEPMGIYSTAIRELAAGRTYYSQRIMNVKLDIAGQDTPTKREREVLSLAARDATTNEIAAQLGISPNSVQTYIRRAFRKLGVNSRQGAVAKAVELGYISSFDRGE